VTAFVGPDGGLDVELETAEDDAGAAEELAATELTGATGFFGAAAGAEGCTGAATGGGITADEELSGTVTVTTRVAVIVATPFPPFCPLSPSAGCAIGTPGVAVVLQVLLLLPALELAPGAPTNAGGGVEIGAAMGLLLAPGAAPPISTAGTLLCATGAGTFSAGGVGFAGGLGCAGAGVGAGTLGTGF
jgi:hypothetical protein